MSPTGMVQFIMLVNGETLLVGMGQSITQLYGKTFLHGTELSTILACG